MQTVQKGSDFLAERMCKFKYDELGQTELNEFYNDVQLLIWKLIHTNYCPLNKMDLHQDIWQHITKVKHTWDETRGTKVSTWLFHVITSKIKTLRKYSTRRNNIIYENAFAQNDTPMVSTVLDDLDDRKTEIFDINQEQYSRRLFNIIMDDLSESEKQYVDLMMNQNKEMIADFGKDKKKKLSKLSQADVGKILGWKRGKTNIFKKKLKYKILNKLEKTDVF